MLPFLQTTASLVFDVLSHVQALLDLLCVVHSLEHEVQLLLGTRLVEERHVWLELSNVKVRHLYLYP